MPEHQNIEYKQSWHDEYLKWLRGFASANPEPGFSFSGKMKFGISESWILFGLISEKMKKMIDGKFGRIKRSGDQTENKMSSYLLHKLDIKKT